MSHQFKLPKIGMRTVKSALAVFLCLALYQVLHACISFIPSGGNQFFQMILTFLNHSNVLYAVFAAIVCMQSTLENSVKSGFNRLIGTAIGGVFGVAFLAFEFVPVIAKLDIIFVSLGVLLVIYCCNVFHCQQSIVIAVFVFMIIMVNYQNENPFLYALNRCIDTAIGTLISILVNRLIRRPLPPQEEVACSDAIPLQEGQALEDKSNTVKQINEDDPNN